MTKKPFSPAPLCLAIATLPWAVQAQTTDTPASVPSTAQETITVFGSGRTRQVNALGSEDLRASLPGSSPLTALNKLPGVNFQSADAFGAYEWSAKLTVRGFHQNQLGFTLDDVPLGDMSYRNHNGLHISRAIASENIQRVLLSQGAGALETASSSNLGGTVQFRSQDPSERRGAHAESTLGTDALRRNFVRLESGSLGGSDTRVALSLLDQRTDKWKGQGEQRQQQVNARLSGRFGPADVSAFVNWSSRKEVDYQDMSLEMIGRLGLQWDNHYPDWNAALNSARGVWSRGETSVDDAYHAGSGLRRDLLAGLTVHWDPSEALNLKTTVYHHRDKGPSLWYTPYVASSATVPVSLRTVEYGIDRSGLLSSLGWRTGVHELRAGFWYEDNQFDQAMRFYSQADGPSSPYSVPSDPMSTRWDYRFDTRTLQWHVSDTARWSPQLRTELGFKSLSSRISARTRAGDDKSGSIEARGRFLPQAGLNYRVDGAHEVFASAARNLRAFKGAAMEDSPFATTPAGFRAIWETLKPETSTTLEGGWRYRDPGRAALEASLTAYHVQFKNRLLAIQQGSSIIGNPVVLANVGRVKTDGVEAGLSWAPVRHWKLWSAVSFNDSRYAEDFRDNGATVRVAGKQVVDAPRWLANGRVNYDDGHWFGQVGVNHVGRRYYTYLNDNSVGAASRWDLSLGLKGRGDAWLSAYRVQLSVSNLFDTRGVASIGTNGFVTSDPQGTAQTLLPAAPRTVALTLAGDF